MITRVGSPIDNDPDDDPADGVSILDVWRLEPFQALGIEQRTIDPVNPFHVCELPLVARHV